MAFEELKQRQSAMWGNGPYERVTRRRSPTFTSSSSSNSRHRQDDAFLDLATGTGGRGQAGRTRGRQVTGVDLAPVLIDTAKEQAAEEGLAIDYVVGDCENLDFADASFDKASSTCGIMFALITGPRPVSSHAVLRPGGRFALRTGRWKGGLGRMFG